MGAPRDAPQPQQRNTFVEQDRAFAETLNSTTPGILPKGREKRVDVDQTILKFLLEKRIYFG